MEKSDQVASIDFTRIVNMYLNDDSRLSVIPILPIDKESMRFVRLACAKAAACRWIEKVSRYN